MKYNEWYTQINDLFHDKLLKATSPLVIVHKQNIYLDEREERFLH